MARRQRKSRADNDRWNQSIQALRLMNFAFNNIRLYPPAHQEVVGVIEKLSSTIGPILEEQDDMGFGFMDEMLYIEGSVSLEETAANAMLVDRFARCRVKYLTIMKGVKNEELVEFFKILNAESTKPTTEHPAELIEKAGIKSIHVVEADVDDLEGKNKLSRKKTLLDWYERAVKTLGEAQKELKEKPEADLRPLYRVIDDMMASMRNRGPEPFLLLPILGSHFDQHLTHCVNVAILAGALADAFRLNSGQINAVCAMAFLHDLGRITIPVEWAHDHSLLTEEERQAAAQHSPWGFLLLMRQDSVGAAAALSAGRHHWHSLREKDGYKPDIFHRILSLADDFDLARMNDRIYWRRHRRERMAARVLNRRGDLYDATLVKLFVNTLGFYPVGSLVRLEDGRKGIVVRPNPANNARPRLWMFDEAPPPPPPPPPGVVDTGPVEPPPVILDTAELDKDSLRYKNTVAALLQPPQGMNIKAMMDQKKEYLLSYSL